MVGSTKPVSVNRVFLCKKRKLRMAPPPRNVVLHLPKKRRLEVEPQIALNSTPGRRIVTKKAIRSPEICDENVGGKGMGAEVAKPDEPIPSQPVSYKRIVCKRAKRSRPSRRDRSSSKKSHLSTGAVSDSGLASRLIGGSHTMLRAVVPRQNLELGFCKPNPRSIFKFLKNCAISGFVDERKHIEILELFSRVQNAILRKPNHEKSLERFYIKLATCSAFEENGIQRMVTIMNETLSLLRE